MYSYTPFCESRTSMDGFRFWKHGYWATHLAGRKYHISALYVVDLVKFRCVEIFFCLFYYSIFLDKLLPVIVFVVNTKGLVRIQIRWRIWTRIYQTIWSIRSVESLEKFILIGWIFLPFHLQVRIHSLPQEWLWCETWCDDASKAKAKTIDLVKKMV